MPEWALAIPLFIAPLSAILVGAWLASGSTSAHPALGTLLALLGGIEITLAFEWVVDHSEVASDFVSTKDWVTLVGGALCAVLALAGAWLFGGGSTSD